MIAPIDAAVPRHVAIIMDGNRRWAREHGLPALEGHRRGIIALRRVTRAASDLGIEIVTVYGFSTENWRRDVQEIAFLFDLCVYFAKSELAELQRNNVRVRIIGDWNVEIPRPRDIFEARLQKEFHALHQEIWSVLKAEVLKGYAQSSQAAAGAG